MNGIIARMVGAKGFGFVTGDDGIERFFHRSGAVSFETLREGQQVSFDEEPSAKGPRATNVKPN